MSNNNNFTLTGRLVHIGETQQKTESFSVREFVIDTEEKFASLIKFQFSNDRCYLLDKYAIGSQVEVHFNVQGRKWAKEGQQDTYFVALAAWKIVGLDAAPAPSAAPAPASDNDTAQEIFGDDDDLPF